MPLYIKYIDFYDNLAAFMKFGKKTHKATALNLLSHVF